MGQPAVLHPHSAIRTHHRFTRLTQTEARESQGFKLNAFEVSARLTSPSSERRALEQAAATGNGATGAQRVTGKKL